MASILGFYRTGEGVGLHDPVVIASSIKPEIMRTRPCDTETNDEELEGQSRIVWSDSDKVRAVTEVDVGAFFSLLGERLKPLP